MPSYEFEELEFQKQEALPDYLPFHEELEASRKKTEAIGLNYWGYKKGFYFAPKASYSKGKNAAAEFKQLVDRMHENQLECVMEFYFEADENQNRILDILRYWRKEYRVDGFHLIGENLPLLAIAQDPILKRTKIFAPSYPEQLWKQKEAYPHLYIYNEEYLFAGRKLINHQGGSLAEFCNQQSEGHAFLLMTTLAPVVILYCASFCFARGAREKSLVYTGNLADFILAVKAEETKHFHCYVIYSVSSVPAPAPDWQSGYQHPQCR